MEKTKLAICIEDEEYKQRFVRCVMKHYKELFEIYVLNQLCELETKKGEEFGAIIIEDDENKLDFSKKYVFFVLQEDRKEFLSANENIYCTDKYQEVYKIIEELQKVLCKRDDVLHRCIERNQVHRIGVFSLSKEMMQLPFSGLLAEVLGENHRVLVVDLQPFSGFVTEIETEGALGMEDLISIALTDNYTVSRLAASIGHEQKWEYIYPAKNTSCISEVGIEVYQKMFEILEKEQAYAYEIINFGSMFSGVIELMESCQELYVLTEKKEERNYREEHFLAEMNRRGKSVLLQKIIWMEMPKSSVKTGSWKQLLKQWLWSSLGDVLRERYWVDYSDGTDM